MPYGVFGDALRVENDMTCELAYLWRDAGPHLVCDEHREAAVMVRRHVAADTLEELRLASGAVLLGRRVRMTMQMDILSSGPTCSVGPSRTRGR